MNPDLNPQARRERAAQVRAARAAGLTFRELAKRFGLSPTHAHRLAGSVTVALPNRWHRARMPKDRPPPPLAAGHQYRVPRP